MGEHEPLQQEDRVLPISSTQLQKDEKDELGASSISDAQATLWSPEEYTALQLCHLEGMQR